MSTKSAQGGDLAIVAAVLLLTLIIGGSFGGMVGLQHWREAQRRAQCVSNLKQISIQIPVYPYPSGSVASTVSIVSEE